MPWLLSWNCPKLLVGDLHITRIIPVVNLDEKVCFTKNRLSFRTKTNGDIKFNPSQTYKKKKRENYFFRFIYNSALEMCARAFWAGSCVARYHSNRLSQSCKMKCADIKTTMLIFVKNRCDNMADSLSRQAVQICPRSRQSKLGELVGVCEMRASGIVAGGNFKKEI